MRHSAISHLVRLNHPPRVCRWVDPRGNYHALFHTWPGAEAISAHAYSRDGLNWDYADTPPCMALCPPPTTTTATTKKPRDGRGRLSEGCVCADYFEAAIGAYGSKVTFSFHRRERPHLMFDGERSPLTPLQVCHDLTQLCGTNCRER